MNSRKITALRALADGDDALAAFNLAERYRYGLEVSEDLYLAFVYYQKAHALGHPLAGYQLAGYYADGLYCEHSRERVFNFVYETAQLGVPCAMGTLGLFYMLGYHAPMNFTEAFRLIKKSMNYYLVAFVLIFIVAIFIYICLSVSSYYQSHESSLIASLNFNLPDYDYDLVRYDYVIGG